MIFSFIPSDTLAEDVELRVDLASFAGVLPACVLDNEVSDERLTSSDVIAVADTCTADNLLKALGYLVNEVTPGFVRSKAGSFVVVSRISR